MKKLLLLLLVSAPMFAMEKPKQTDKIPQHTTTIAVAKHASLNLVQEIAKTYVAVNADIVSPWFIVANSPSIPTMALAAAKIGTVVAINHYINHKTVNNNQ